MDRIKQEWLTGANKDKLKKLTYGEPANFYRTCTVGTANYSPSILKSLITKLQVQVKGYSTALTNGPYLYIGGEDNKGDNSWTNVYIQRNDSKYKVYTLENQWLLSHYSNSSASVNIKFCDSTGDGASGEFSGSLYLDDFSILIHYSLTTYNIYLRDSKNLELIKTIKYDALGDDETKEKDSFTLPEPSKIGYTKTGYNFKGWSLDPNATEGSTISIPKNTSGDLTYYAIWEPVEYTITCTLSNSESIIKYTIESDTFTLEEKIGIPEKYGYNFDGWTGTDLHTKVEQVIISTGTIGNKQYYAQWDPIKYNIYYEPTIPTGKWVNKDEFPKFYTIEQNISFPQPTRQGYTFVKWTETGTKDASIPVNSSGDKTFNMEFKANNVTVSGYTRPSNVGTVKFTYSDNHNIENSFNIDYSDNYLISNITIDYNNKDYRFDHWERKSNPNQVYGESGKDILSNIELSYSNDENEYIAVFEQIEYKVNVIMETGNGTQGIFGAVVTDNIDITNNISDTISIGQNIIGTPITTISGLKYGDKRNINIIPYVINENEKYHFENWSSGDMILSINIDDTWDHTNPKKDYTVILDKINLNNRVYDDDSDNNCIKQILEKTISNFVLKNTVNALGDYCFQGCTSLKYVYMPGADSIGANAFKGCEELRSLVISSESAGQLSKENPFIGCKKLNLLILPGESLIALNCLFAEEDGYADEDLTTESREKQSLFRKKIGRIYVNSNLLESYQSAKNWSTYQDIICPIDDKIFKAPQTAENNQKGGQ